MTSQQQLLQLTLHLQSSGLNEGSSGNCSLRHDNGFFITPSGLNPKKMTEEDMVWMNFEGHIKSNQKPAREPSSEWRFHHDILKLRSDANVVIHTHSTFATTLSLFRQDIPAFHYMIAVAGGNSIRCSQYKLFGTQELSNATLKALEGRKACLLANHGMIAIGHDIEDALNITHEVERLCEQYTYAMQIGLPIILSDEEMNDVIDKFQSYGSWNKF
ncbi:MAG: class II aldolase [Candidatus Methylopumilus sp.]|nr:class II aldolase [Candidatus Methylopumilus sp.]